MRIAGSRDFGGLITSRRADQATVKRRRYGPSFGKTVRQRGLAGHRRFPSEIGRVVEIDLELLRASEDGAEP